MNKVTFPLESPMQGIEVGDLQAALQAFIDRVVILRDSDEAARQEMSALLKRELLMNKYGDVTVKLVSTFQKERQLPETGKIDQATANAMNALLRELGLLDEQPIDSQTSFVVSRRVQREDELLMEGILVRATHETGDMGAVRLGEDTTNAEGRYTIRYELLPEALA